MRPGLSSLLLALSPCLVAPVTHAEDAPTSLIQIDDALFTQHSELQAALDLKNEQQAELEKHQRELDSLAKKAIEFDNAFADAKTKLESDYQRMIDDPSVDIEKSQAAYQQAWANVKQNQKARLSAEQTLAEQQAVVETQTNNVETVKQAINKLDTAKLRARATQLDSELKQPKQLTISFTNRCQAAMTLAQCDQQTKELALQKAVKQFQADIVNQVSEQALVKRNISKSSLNIHVLSHQTNSQGFYDGERYRTMMDVDLEARPKTGVACDLLQIDRQYCFAPGAGNFQPTEIEQEIAWVSLSIRSNVHGDSVSIGDVSYGSTPVEVMLPVGLHDVVVSKEGYERFAKQITLRADSSMRAVLVEKSNPLREGTKFSDSFKDHQPAPEVVTLLPGTYYIGEHASNQVYLDHAFGFGATPVTVSQFAKFVEQTDYQTDAELKNTCTSLTGGQVSPIERSSWRNPGFKQYNNSPVVCVSQNDAKSYTKWLSAQTGASYRLPSEDEWEIAARAGSQDRYWWGNEFIPGQANTGWSGTPWSNESTAPVSAFKPNRLGIYDAVGNVWQWTNETDGIAKGGAWNFSPDMASAGKQLILAPHTASNYLGFRVVREIN